MATSNVGKIRLKNLNELQETTHFCESSTTTTKEIVVNSPETPKKVSTTSRSRRAATTTKKARHANNEDTKNIVENSTVKRTSKKEPPQGQLRIDSFFKSTVKNYKVEIDLPKTTLRSLRQKKTTSRTPKKGRKRLFHEETTTTSTSQSDETELKIKIRGTKKKRNQPLRHTKINNIKVDSNDIIDLCSDDENVEAVPTSKTPEQNKQQVMPIVSLDVNLAAVSTSKTSEKNQQQFMTIIPLDVNKKHAIEKSTTSSLPPISGEKATTSRRPRGSPRPCPPYKIIEGTNFCVDGFQFGVIANVTHYFLSHYHADHYIGLTRKFAHPIYMSPTTARLVRTFIQLDDIYINEIEVDQTIIIDNIEITALDANHCPGALMFYFKLSSGQTILHTGDFRANFDMESLPIFWNNLQLDLLYLDTTYLNKNYDFCHQSESIDRALRLVEEFHHKHRDKRILHVCGSYVIGKEKIWLTIAKEFGLKVWTEPHRRQAIDCLKLPDAEKLLCDDPNVANLHVIGLGQISYPSLVEYLDLYQNKYDMILGLRPSGWEKNRKPSYGKRISVLGIEYSEHSSYRELERFVRYLRPNKVISTVPVERDLFITGKVPTQWYQYEGPACMLPKAFQPSITTFLKQTPQNQSKTTKSSPSCKSIGNSEMIISPLSPLNNEDNDNADDKDEHLTITPDHVTIASSVDVNCKSTSTPGKPKQENEPQPVSRLTSDASDDMLSFL